MLNGKVIKIHLIVGLIKKMLLYKICYCWFNQKYWFSQVFVSNITDFVQVCIITEWTVTYLLMVPKYTNSKQNILK